MLFKHFPLVTYDDKIIRDFTRHVSFLSDLENNPYVYLPYTLEDGDRPEDISFHYYGTVEYTPYVLMANGVVDPYLDWLMTDEQLNNHIVKKYQTRSNKKGNDIIRWAMNRTRFDNIVFFYKGDMFKHVDTYIDEFVPTEHQKAHYETPEQVDYVAWASDWEPLRIYDMEVQKNEDKRTINLVDDTLMPRIHEKFKDLISR